MLSLYREGRANERKRNLYITPHLQMKVVAVIQARMRSTRLPGKVLLPVAGRPLLSYLLERLRRCNHIQDIVVATSIESADDAIVTLCELESAAVERGPELDVLKRFAIAAEATNAEAVVRITADCPLIEPQLVDFAVQSFAAADCDYLSNMMPPTWPYGMAVEVMTRRALDEADGEARDPSEREHVTPFLYWRPQRFRLKSITRRPDLSAHRWTVDTQEDFELVSLILKSLYPKNPNFTIDDVLDTLFRNPEWIDINRNVKQKVVTSSSEVHS